LIGRLAPGSLLYDNATLGLAPNPDRPKDFPPIGPRLGREIDAAVTLLRSVPFEELQRRGWHLQPNSYATPLNDVPFLREHPELWLEEEIPAEVEWDLDGQLELLRTLHRYTGELSEVPHEAAGPGRFHWGNEVFPSGDASAYYGIVRHLQPRRVIEVGAGWSTLVLKMALEANDRSCEVTLIEPDLKREVVGELSAGWQVEERPLQLADLAVFEDLGPQDVVFYDGSHCVRTASDVNWMFFQVLPRLAPGVWIHVHDLSWPRDYSAIWVLDEGLTWNEQYLVQAFLMGNASYRVRLAVSMLALLRSDEVEALFDRFPGASLWIEKVARPGVSSRRRESRPA
jgi:hypothetical protein